MPELEAPEPRRFSWISALVVACTVLGLGWNLFAAMLHYVPEPRMLPYTSDVVIHLVSRWSIIAFGLGGFMLHPRFIGWGRKHPYLFAWSMIAIPGHMLWMHRYLF